MRINYKQGYSNIDIINIVHITSELTLELISFDVVHFYQYPICGKQRKIEELACSIACPGDFAANVSGMDYKGF